MPDIAWLNDEEARAWRAYIDLSMLLGDYLDRQLRRDADMSHTSYHLLGLLSAQPGHSLRLTDLAQQMRITRSRLSHALARLEELGWVRREDDPADRRGHVATLTDRGFEVLSAAAPGHVDAVRRAVFDRLSAAQVQQFAEIAETLVNGLIAQDEGPAATATAAAGAAATAYPAKLPWRRR